MNDIRLIACDMDGTLLGPDGKVSPGNAAALGRAVDAGIALLVASGRSPGEIATLMRGVDAPFDILSMNGALVRLRGHDDMRRPLSPAHIALCADAAEENGIPWVVFTGESILDSERNEKNWRNRAGSVTRDEAVALADSILKFVAFDRHGNPEGLLRARDAAQRAGLAVASSWTNNFEVNAPGVDKGSALRAAADALGIRRGQVMALGDYENDLTMLAWAGWSVAMGNALPRVAAAARYQTATNAEDGVAQAILRWALP